MGRSSIGIGQRGEECGGEVLFEQLGGGDAFDGFVVEGGGAAGAGDGVSGRFDLRDLGLEPRAPTVNAELVKVFASRPLRCGREDVDGTDFKAPDARLVQVACAVVV